MLKSCEDTPRFGSRILTSWFAGISNSVGWKKMSCDSTVNSSDVAESPALPAAGAGVCAGAAEAGGGGNVG